MENGERDMRDYIALIRKEDGTCYGVDFPDFPGCISAGDTLEEALEGAREALALYVEDMIAEREALPVPSDLDAVMADPHNRGAVAALVPAPEGARRWRRINITMDEDLLARIEAAAGKGRRSEFLEEGARLLLAEDPAALRDTPGVKHFERPSGAKGAVATGETAVSPAAPRKRRRKIDLRPRSE